MKPEDVTAEDLLVEVDGLGVHPGSVDPLALLRVATAYIDLLQHVAADRGVALVLSGLWSEDKCAALRTSAADASMLPGPVRDSEKYLTGAPAPYGIKGRVGNVYKAIRSLPSGLVPSVRTGNLHFRLTNPEELEASTPWAKTRLWVTPQEVGGNGVLDHVILESASESGPFTLKLSADMARQLGASLHRPVLAEMLVVRDIEGRIDKGELIEFTAPNVPPGEGLAAWRKWAEDNVDVEATFEELRSKD